MTGSYARSESLRGASTEQLRVERRRTAKVVRLPHPPVEDGMAQPRVLTRSLTIE